jgi:hypothetical protein
MKAYRAEFLITVDFNLKNKELTKDNIFEMFFNVLNLEKYVFNGLEVKPSTFVGEGHINERPEDLSSLLESDMTEV